jgi:hypothetical protein
MPQQAVWQYWTGYAEMAGGDRRSVGPLCPYSVDREGGRGFTAFFQVMVKEPHEVFSSLRPRVIALPAVVDRHMDNLGLADMVQVTGIM